MTFYAPLYRSIVTAAGCVHVQCSLRVGLTVFIPESDTGAVMMIMVVDLYHDVCVSVSSRWLLISGFSRSHCPRLSKETLSIRSRIPPQNWIDRTKPLLALINKYVLLILCFHKTNSLISLIIMYTKKSHAYRQVSNHRYNRSTEKGICRAEWTRSGCSSKYSDDMEYIPPIIARDS